MKLVGLISGGKDGIFNMLQCIAAGHEVVAIANIEPAGKAELDSYMYQSVGHEALTLIAGALSLPIYRYKTKGKAFCMDKTYTQTPLDEVEDLYELLRTVKKEMHIDGVSVGAIASDYQRTRVENVCHRLNLKSFAFLWRRNQAELLQEIIDAELDAIVVKVASIGLNPNTHLGKHISELQDNLIELNQKFGVHICGEGGEYETLTLDCPLFHRVIHITQIENKIQSNDAFAPVGFLIVKSAELREKDSYSNDPVKSLQARKEHIRSVVKDPYYYVKDCMETVVSDNFPEMEDMESPENETPFPLASKEKKETALTLSEERRNKEMGQQSLNIQRSVSDCSGVYDTISSNFNFSTGWCCIGNIAASNFVDAFFLLKKHLERNNYEFEDITFVSIYLRYMSDFSALNNTYSQFMPDISPPSRVCVATELPSNVRIIMLVVAHKLVSKSQKALHSPVVEKGVLHVQSISHWAPANIGPYSQCVKVGEIYYLSGQIPLIPGTMEIIKQPIYYQCLLTLRHVIRVLQAFNEQLSYSNILQAICYVTSEEVAHDIKSFWTSITKNENSIVSVFVVTELPRKANLEWEVLACGLTNPHVEEVTQTADDLVLHMKRCVHTEPYALSFFCKVSFTKKVNKEEKNLKIITEKAILTAINNCLQFGRSNIKTFGTSLCILKVFYKSSVALIGSVIRDAVRTGFDSKVVMTAIPIVACENPDIIFTITGVCH